MSWILKDKDDFPNSAADRLQATESTWIHPDSSSSTFRFHLGSCHQEFPCESHKRVDISCVFITQPFIRFVFCSCLVAKLCPTLCDPVDCNTPGFCNSAHFSVRDKLHFPSSFSNLYALGEPWNRHCHCGPEPLKLAQASYATGLEPQTQTALALCRSLSRGSRTLLSLFSLLRASLFCGPDSAFSL